MQSEDITTIWFALLFRNIGKLLQENNQTTNGERGHPVQ